LAKISDEGANSQLLFVLLEWLIVGPFHLYNKVTYYYIRWNMLLLVTNIEWQTSNVSNKTFEPTEQLISKRILRDCRPRLSIRPARNEI
jgi:hypothetical protein